MDAEGNVAVAGYTGSTDFPTTLGAFQPTFGGGSSDAFVTKLTSAGTVIYSTFLGGSGADGRGGCCDLDGVAMDPTGNAYVTGQTSSTNFPVLNPIQPTLAGASDAFVTELNPSGNGLVFSTYLGGSGNDGGGRIALDTLPNPNVYVAGTTGSNDFPVTTGAFQTTYGGGASDAFVTKISEAPSCLANGGGHYVNNGEKHSFGGNAESVGGIVSGHLNDVDHANGLKINGDVIGATCVSANSMRFEVKTKDGCYYLVTYTDNGEPGAGKDTIEISAEVTKDSSPAACPNGTAGPQTLTAGNIQVIQ
jgi:hypothetical protein